MFHFSKNHRQNYKYFVNVVEQRKVHLFGVKHWSIHFAKSVILEELESMPGFKQHWWKKGAIPLHFSHLSYTTTITLSKMGEWGIYPVPSSAAPAYDNWGNGAYLFSSTLCIKKVISDVNVHFSKLAEKYFVTTHKVHFKIALFFLILDYCASIWGDSHCKSFKKSQKDSMLFQQQQLLKQQKNVHHLDYFVLLS